MKLTRWRPNTLADENWTDTFSFSNMLDSFFDEAFGRGVPAQFTPRMDVSETRDAYEISVELPGLNKNDIHISMEDHLLTIRGERKEEKEQNNKRYHRLERRYGAFERSLPLPQNVKEKEIEANYENGILHVTVPKTEKSTAKEIKVK